MNIPSPPKNTTPNMEQMSLCLENTSFIGLSCWGILSHRSQSQKNTPLKVLSPEEYSSHRYESLENTPFTGLSPLRNTHLTESSMGNTPFIVVSLWRVLISLV